ncbi:MAG TPA: hypothetical protein VN026_18560 [Bacteroidia bacterium]|jgi:DNA repair exonuclease SbcCD ATPase subunit|nr:hypothetical protein [Bacteroidia bacterium]
MKQLILIAATIFVTSCNDLKLSDKDLTRANVQKDSLLQIANEREESINQFISSFNEIERNLDSVAAKQQFINVNTPKYSRDFKIDQKSRINDQIASINNLMNQNAEKIIELKRKLKNSSKKNAHLEETIATLNNQLTQKTIELSLLNDRLTSLDLQVAQLQTKVDTLTGQNLAQSETIKQNVSDLHTAYYVIGETKDLQEAQVIDRKGGLLGIGKTSKLSDNFDKNKFTKIDYTQTGSIPVNDRAKIITTHPADSYTLDMDTKDKKLVKNILITNPEKFWSASKYLVIVKS